MKNGLSKLWCSVRGSTFWGHIHLGWYANSTSERITLPYCISRPFSDGTVYVQCEYKCRTKRIHEPICRIEYGGRKEAFTVDGPYEEIEHLPETIPSIAMIIILSVMASCGVIVCSIVTVIIYVQKRYRNQYVQFE